MKILLLDGKNLEFKAPISVIEIAKTISTSLGKVCLGGIVNEKIVPANFLISQDAKLEIITDKSELKNEIKKYSAKILIQCAIKNLYQNSIISSMYETKKDDMETGASFLLKDRIKIENLKDVQKEINKLLKSGTKIEFVSNDLNKYKKELNDFYNNKEYVDFILQEAKNNLFSVAKYNNYYFVATYAYLENPVNLKQIELINLTGEYWLGDANNEMLQKIHALCGSAEEIKNIKAEIELREQSDHRLIGKQLDIFTINPLIGQGLPIWLPNGTIIKEQIKNYLKAKEFEYDFVQVDTPNIGTSELYKISGHWDHYKDDMFAPMDLPKEQCVLRPMACPHHIQVFKYKPRTYKELPLRIAEHASLYRYEASGALVGLERVRSMELTDSHIFARPDQIKQEFKHCYKLIKEVLDTFKIDISYLSLSLRDPKDKEKYYQDEAMWNDAEKQLEEVLNELGINYKKMIGEAAFYGPKLDIQAKTMLGHEITVSTIQLDFLLPKKFDVNYIGKNHNLERAVMIHRGLIGTYERFISILLEQTKGVLPLWLAPVQVQIIPVSEDFNEYAVAIRNELKVQGIRTFIDNRDERLSYKIREAQIKKVPYQVILGEKELKSQNVAYRLYGEKNTNELSVKEFIKQLQANINLKK
ncbi:threonine--tRNA ligase [Spiroplasma endosymbiont of Crioceris asparagi]|uniref:threonine--tRNA ligase n=1 Tax=Spiroplasma endosymbiont of Crioceris asparagi TaxID=3066286 RepID=UPI0030CAC73A